MTDRLSMHVAGSPTADTIRGVTDALQELLGAAGVAATVISGNLRCDTCGQASRPVNMLNLDAEIVALVADGWTRDPDGAKDECPRCSEADGEAS